MGKTPEFEVLAGAKFLQTLQIRELLSMGLSSHNKIISLVNNTSIFIIEHHLFG